jgi:archaellum component FlaG (FlaF/FlaG flagellin family)
MATNASYFSTQNLEESYTFAIKSFGERMLYYDQNTITEFNSKGEPTTERAQEMKAILGTKGVTWLEVYKDMPYQNCILTVTNSTTVQDRLQLMELTAQYEQSGKVPAGTLLMAMGIPNFKLAKLYVVFAIKRQERINAENAEKMMQIQGQQQEQAFLASQSAEQQKLEQEGQIQARLTALENSLKTQGQIDVKDKTNSNRLVENQQQTELNIQQEKAKKDMETY